MEDSGVNNTKAWVQQGWVTLWEEGLERNKLRLGHGKDG